MTPLTDIIKLCDIPWIQERWELKNGDWYIFKGESKLRTLYGKFGREVLYDFRATGTIWLPLNFNPETGRNQLTDLLIEAGNFESEPDMNLAHAQWRLGLEEDEHGNIKEPPERGVPYQSDVIDYLAWLHELVGGES